MKKTYKIILTIIAGYGILSNLMYLIWIFIGGRIMLLTPLGLLSQSYELMWYVPLCTLIPFIVFLVMLWKKENETKNNKKGI